MGLKHTIRRGFTLVEILIVVVILGILAAIVVPQFASASDDARVSAFIGSLKNLETSMEMYRAREGSWPPDTSTGTWQAELTGYIKQGDFEVSTPIGGAWDTETNESGVAHAVGAMTDGADAPDAVLLLAVDEQFDDGDLATGRFRGIRPGGWYLVLAE